LLWSALGQDSAYPLLGPAAISPWPYVVMAALVGCGSLLCLQVPVWAWIASASASGSEAITAIRERQLLASIEIEEIPEESEDEPDADALPIHPVPAPRATAAKTNGQGSVAEPVISGGNHPGLPPLDLFVPAPKGQAAPADLDYKAQRIAETLSSFNVGARVVGHHSGPVVTQFDVQPDRGVKVKSIVALQNDLALALAAPTIRIQAPVPGKPVVGIEIPNTSASMVTLRDLLESESYRSMKSALKVALGKDVTGNPGIIDLAKMPHLLIAGATGSGKSVCVNAIISCLLYNNTPDDVRLMMVDPKMVELTVYNGVPHLLSPVVTQMDKVVGVLQWALREMERRYQLFATTTVRNISRYNEKMEANGLKKLPYIVFIIDELADLMMVAPEDVEDAVCRLAQLARAAGIHLVIATQRPSVDVVTGLIKANFPARIAFAMTSQVDSRTILDRVGAEKLLGRGDMLYMPPDGPSTLRLQGANVTDQELERLVEFWQRSPLQAAMQRIAPEEFEAAEKQAARSNDELFDEAARVVREHKHASVSLLQRRLKVGYSRAARLMDQLESHGVVGAADGSKQRAVLSEGAASE
jgi:S-DNA-T family DNA segregation ATPase FtsK/SpoIIIE